MALSKPLLTLLLLVTVIGIVAAIIIGIVTAAVRGPLTATANVTGITDEEIDAYPFHRDEEIVELLPNDDPNISEYELFKEDHEADITVRPQTPGPDEALSDSEEDVAPLSGIQHKELSESSHGSSDSPVITSMNFSEIVVNPGENYTITCEGDTPVIWNYPNISDNVPEIHGTWKNGKYVSSIQLTDITYKDVGYYHCFLDNNSEKNSSIYLYVNDTENLLTYSDLIFQPVHALQYQEVIIPCKPTHPGVKVSLCRFGDEMLHIGENEDFGVIRYDQKVGFILENAHMRYNGFYSCCVHPGAICSEDECPRHYSLEVLRHADSVPRPVIDVANLQHVKVGENVTIECRVTVPISTRYELEWIIPNQSDRITVENIEIAPPKYPGHHLTTGRRKLRILNAQLEDAGNYTCKVEDHARNTNSETIYFNIFSE